MSLEETLTSLSLPCTLHILNYTQVHEKLSVLLPFGAFVTIEYSRFYRWDFIFVSCAGSLLVVCARSWRLQVPGDYLLLQKARLTPVQAGAVVSSCELCRQTHQAAAQIPSKNPRFPVSAAPRDADNLVSKNKSGTLQKL